MTILMTTNIDIDQNTFSETAVLMVVNIILGMDFTFGFSVAGDDDCTRGSGGESTTVLI